MDFKRYEFTLDCDYPHWLTDLRHIEVIYEFLMANDFTRVAEIGSYSGLSTAAFIEALNQGKNFKLHIAEPNPTRQLEALLSMCKKPDIVVLHVKTGEHLLEHWTGFDFVFIDGNHSIDAAGAELLMVLRNEIPTVMAHDTNLTSLDSNYDGKGAELLGRVLKSHKDYYWVEDKEKRPDEHTERGLFFASKRKDKHEIAKRIFEELC